jgi:hypothetical protein
MNYASTLSGAPRTFFDFTAFRSECVRGAQREHCTACVEGAVNSLQDLSPDPLGHDFSSRLSLSEPV